MDNVTIGGQPLSTYGAKMQSDIQITSAEIDTGVFQGVNRSTMHVLHNRRGAKYLTCRIDFIGSAFERAMHQSSFEALFLGADPVTIDISDGFWYKAVLLSASVPASERDLITTVEYRFQVTRHHGNELTVDIEHNNAGNYSVYAHGNAPQMDCRIIIPTGNLMQLTSLEVRMNDEKWTCEISMVSGHQWLVLDGIDKVFTLINNGVATNVTASFIWTDFPALRPGANTIQFFGNGLGFDGPPQFCVIYTPTYL